MRDEAGGSDTGGPEPDDHGGAGTERQGSGPGEPASSNDCRKHRWRRWVLWIVLLIIIAFIAAWGIRKWIYGRHHESTNDAQVSGHLVPVLNRVGAYVAEVYVHDGDHVAAGQLLVRLEETDLRPALLESEVAVAEGQARLQLSQTRITAPVTGVVANRSVEPGQLLEPGQPLMVVVADSGVYITANFKETQVAKLRPGQPVEIDIDAYGDCDARGVVAALGGATGSEFALLPPNNATGNFVKVVQRIPVRIEVTRGCGPERRLRPGMSVAVHVRIGDRK